MFKSVGFSSIALANAAVSGTVSAWLGDEWSLAIFGISFAVLFAGFAGALIALALMPGIRRWYVALGVGSGVSAYTTPAAVVMIHKYTALGLLDGRPVAAAIGLFAYLLLSMVFKDGRDIIVGWLKTKAGIKRKEESCD